MKIAPFLTLALATVIAPCAHAKPQKDPYRQLLGRQENLCGVFQAIPSPNGVLLQFWMDAPAAPAGKLYLDVQDNSRWPNPMSPGKFYCLDATVAKIRLTYDNGEAVDEDTYEIQDVTGVRDSKGRSLNLNY